jgi:hypothetical protein
MTETKPGKIRNFFTLIKQKFDPLKTGRKISPEEAMPREIVELS